MSAPLTSSSSSLNYYRIGLRQASSPEKAKIQGYCHELGLPIEEIAFRSSLVYPQSVDVKGMMIPLYPYYDLVQSFRSSSKLNRDKKELKNDEVRHYIPILHEGLSGRLFKLLKKQDLASLLSWQKKTFEGRKHKRENTEGFLFSKFMAIPGQSNQFLELITTRPDHEIVNQLDLSENTTPLLADYD